MRVAVALPTLAPDAIHRKLLDHAIESLSETGVDIECFVESNRLREGSQTLPTYHYLRLHERHAAKPFDTGLYPLGRDYRPYEPAWLLAKQFPAVVWILDPVLHHLMVGGMVMRGRWDAYWRASERTFGPDAAWAVQTLTSSWATPAFYGHFDPVPGVLADQRLLLAATDAIAAAWPEDNISGVVDLPCGELSADAATRTEAQSLTVVSMNFNRPQPVLGALRQVLARLPGTKISVFAPPLTHLHLLAPAAAAIGGLGQLEWRLTAEWAEMQREIGENGCVAFLRSDLSVGERALLHWALAAGKTVIVLRTLHYSPYPEGAVIKVDPGVDMVAQLAEAMMLLSEAPPPARDVGDEPRRLAGGFATAGERALLHWALNAGKRVIMLRTRHDSRYPVGAVIKVDPDADMVAQLPEAMMLLSEPTPLARGLGNAARKLAGGFPGSASVASTLRKHLERAAAEPSVWVDISAPVRRTLADRLRMTALPTNRSVPGIRLADTRLREALGARWFPAH